MAKPGKSWDQTLDNMYNIVHGDEQESAPMIDPIAYRSDYRPEDIKADWRNDPNIPWVWPRWANEHFNEYWDDSNPSWQGFKWWLNEKYTGEWVKTSMVDYDPNITTGWLDPNYMFWDAARNSDTKESWYLAKRNDMIASALYNEWKVSREDVANYLSAQKWWFDSTEADRQNTIESIYKRLWQLSPEQQKKADEWKADNIVKDNSWELYGKTTAEEWNPKEWIQTLADANSPFTAMEQARADNLKNLISMQPQDIATALDNWLLPWDLQSIRDLQQFYPEIWDEVKQYQKKTKAQNVVNSITTWWEISTENNGQSVINNSIADFSNKNAWDIKSSQEITADVNNALAQNQTANEASETMASIESDMAVLKNRLKNIRAEATAAFKWDVPDYLVNAYIANKSQEIQNQMQILEDRYNMAFNRYKTEVANTQWEKEFELKKEELQLKKDSLALEEYKAKNWTSTTTKTNTDTSTVKDENWNQIAVKNDEDLAAAVDYLLEQFDYWKLGNGQCAAGIQKYYFPLIWISIWNLSSFDRKKSLINEEKGYIPKKWDLIILSSKSSPENWHIWIVIWVEWWYVQYLDWNGSLGKDWKWSEKAAINSMPIDSAKIQWYRNVNKWQDWIYNGETEETTTDNQWTEQDYSNFEKLLDPETNQTTVKAIASKYWYEDNIPALTEIAKNALNNRPKDEEETKETEESDGGKDEIWYDKEGWYNKLHSKFYQQFFNDRLYTVENLAKDTWTSEEEARIRAMNWKSKLWKTWDNENWGQEEYNDAQRMLMQQLANWTLKPTEEYAEMLGFWWDVALLWEAVMKVEKEEAKKQLDDALRTFAELQILYEDADRISEDWIWDTNITQTWDWASALSRKRTQAKASLLLDKVVKARWDWVTFGAMTEYEWKKLDEAASALIIWPFTTDESFTTEMNSIITRLWAAQYWEPGWPIIWPTKQQWWDFVKSVRNSSDFKFYNTKEDSNKDARDRFDKASWWTWGWAEDDASDWISW